ncbi:MAG: hypothetical protein K2L08_04115, partial [Erysipelotrichaceae bacterium]|nr:hypothetical protein [Erysipelotrichaceae bacterium]
AEDAEAYAKNSLLVRTSSLGYEDIPTVEVQSTTTIKIGDVNYYVLANDGEKALLWAKNSVGSYSMRGSDNSSIDWNNSNVRNELNSTWLNNQPNILKENIIETQIYYSDISAKTVQSTYDKVFLLSIEDINGLTGEYAANDQRLLTMGEKIANLSKLTGDSTLLRHSNTAGTVYVLSGTSVDWIAGYSSNARPAFWVYLPGKKPVVDNEGTDTEEASEVSIS